MSVAIDHNAVNTPGRSTGWLGRIFRFLSRDDLRLPLLLIACFIPRAIVAFRLRTVCDDGYFYLQLADSLDEGNIAKSLDYLNINVYPVVLAALHRLGFDWIAGAKIWGVVMGTLLVVPLFNWLQRMFDRRTASVAVFLYAIHPKVIENTVEPIREVTFWLFFVLCLDFFWRALESRRWGQFFAAGAFLALALHTRVEGWYLLLPLTAWAALRWWRVPAARLRLVSGGILCAAITPLFILAVNTTLLAHHPNWEFGRLHPFVLLGSWLRTSVVRADATTGPSTLPNHGPAPFRSEVAPHPVTARQSPQPESTTLPGGQPQSSDRVVPVAHEESTIAPRGDQQAANRPEVATESLARPAPPPPPQTEGAIPGGQARMPFSVRARLYFSELARTLGLVFLGLALVGLARLRSWRSEPEKAVLVVLTLATLVAIWIRLTESGELNGRYFLILIVIDGAFAASACLALARWLDGLALRMPGTRFSVSSLGSLLWVALLTAGWAQAFCHQHAHRDAQARLGKWIGQHAGPFESVACDFLSMRTAYVAAGTMPTLVKFDDLYEPRFDRRPPDLIIASPASLRPDLCICLGRRARQLGLARMDPGDSGAGPQFLIYARAARSAEPVRHADARDAAPTRR